MPELTSHSWIHSDTTNMSLNESGTPAQSFDAESIVNFQFYAWGVAGNVISILGLIGNILSIVVLCNHKLRTSTSLYLVALAIYDSLVLVSLVLFMALPTLHMRIMAPYLKIFPYMQPIGYPIALTAQTCSIYTIVGFTVERYIAVCHPLKATKFCTISRAQKSVLLIFLCSVAYNIPRMLEYKTEVYLDNSNNTYAKYVYTDLGKSPMFRHIYFIYMHISFMLLIPFTVLTLLNIALIRAVRRSSRAQGKQLTRRQRTENNLTVMLISVIGVFLICEVPSILDNIFMATLEQRVLESAPFIRLTCISSLMVITNSATNFYLYCCFGQKFRHIFCKIFCEQCLASTKRFLRNENMIQMSTSSSCSQHRLSERPLRLVTRGNSSVSEHLYDGSDGHDSNRNHAVIIKNRLMIPTQLRCGRNKHGQYYRPILDNSSNSDVKL